VEHLLFGISGLPIGDRTTKYHYASGIDYTKAYGLDAMELLFVRNVNVTDTNREVILKAKQDNHFYLSAHGSHYINLNAAEPEKQEQSMIRIISAARGLAKVQGRSLIFHPGFYLKDTKEKAYDTIKKNLLQLPYFGVDYRLETTGRKSQFGTLQELTALCKEVGTCKLCIDFAHIHARENGGLKCYADFAGILQFVYNQLGREALEDMHIHIGGISYDSRGEIRHLPLRESDFNYRDCLKALKAYDVKGCVICEGPLLEIDALLLKKTYHLL
jgi:deoxyribonuclease-4